MFDCSSEDTVDATGSWLVSQVGGCERDCATVCYVCNLHAPLRQCCLLRPLRLTYMSRHAETNGSLHRMTDTHNFVTFDTLPSKGTKWISKCIYNFSVCNSSPSPTPKPFLCVLLFFHKSLHRLCLEEPIHISGNITVCYSNWIIGSLLYRLSNNSASETFSVWTKTSIYHMWEHIITSGTHPVKNLFLNYEI